MARTRATAAATRSPTKKLGDANPDSDTEEPVCPIQAKQGAAAASRLKKADAAKKAKKVSTLSKKKRVNAKKPFPAPLNSEDDDSMTGSDAGPDATNIEDTQPAPRLATLSFDYKHLGRYLGKAKKSSFTKRDAEERVQIAQKIEQDLQRINYWIGEQAVKSSPIRKRNVRIPVEADSRAKKSGKGKGRAKAVESDEEVIEDEDDMMDDNDDDVSVGKLPFYSPSSHSTLQIAYLSVIIHYLCSLRHVPILPHYFPIYSTIFGFHCINSLLFLLFAVSCSPLSFRFWCYSESRADDRIV